MKLREWLTFRKRPRRLWWQWVLRVGAAVAMAAVALYALLPWWLPTRWIAERLQRDLSVQMGAPVTVGGVSVSWSDGVCVESIRALDPACLDGAPAVEIPELRLDFSPLRMALGAKVAWVVVERPLVRVSAGQACEWDVAALAAATPDVPFKELNVREAVVLVTATGRDQPVRLEIADLQCRGGRRASIERVSMSAALVGPGPRVTFALDGVMTYSPSGRPRPLLTCSLTGLDLAALELVELFGLPLEQMEGVCEARVRLPVVEGKITNGSVMLTIDRLNVQPVDGPRLPEIDQARLVLGGDVDLATGEVSLRIDQLRGPGVELSGWAHFGASLLAGNFLAVDSLKMTGSVDPQTVASLLNPDPVEDDRWSVAGAVSLDLSYLRGERGLETTVDLEAGAAEIAVGSHVIKPAGQTLHCTLAALCRERTWQFVVDRTELHLGENHFVGSGALANVGSLWNAWTRGEQEWTSERLVADLAALDWVGRWDIVELESLRRLGPPVADALAEVRLDGRVHGSWSLEHGAATKLQLTCVADAPGRLQVGAWLDKPVGVEMAVSAEVSHNADSGGMQPAVFTLTCGDGAATVTLDDFHGASPSAVDPSDGRLRGSYRVDRIEQFLRCVDSSSWDGRLSGSVAGLLALRGFDDALVVDASVDATQLRLWVGDVLEKQAGQPAMMTVGARWDLGAPRFSAVVDAELPGAVMAGHAWRRGEDWRVAGDLYVNDVAWLSDQSPVLTNLDCRLDGAADVHAEVAAVEGAIAGRVDVNADDLAVAFDNSSSHKARGRQCRASVDVRLDRPSSDGPAVLQVSSAALTLGGSTASCSGRVELARDDRTSIDMTTQFDLAVDSSLRSALGELDALLVDAGVVGRASGACRVWGVPSRLRSEGRLDATAAGAAWAAPLAVTKPAGMPATLQWTATLTGLPAGVQAAKAVVNDWRFRVGPLEGMGDASIRLAGGDDAFLAGGAQFRLWASRAEAMPTLIPTIGQWAPAGDGEVRGRLRLGADGVLLRDATIRLVDLSGVYQDRRASADGTVLLEGIRLVGPDLRPRLDAIARLTTDNLRLTSDAGALAAVIDLRDLTDGPRGSIAVLGERVDAEALREWLAPREPLPADTEAYRTDLLAEMRAGIDEVRSAAAGAELTVAADIRRVSHFPDDRVGQVYDVDNLSLRASLADGRIKIRHASGVNGGTLIERFETDLNSPDPQVRYISTIRDMMGTDNLQPQVAAFFPGNEVRGAMWRELDVQTSLAEMAAGMVDPRLPFRYEGWGKTTFINGVTRGRGAPRFVTRVFPGLDLVDYEYERMVAFGDYRPDGSVHNDMIYTGKKYNLFVEGVTGADNTAEYDVGVILARTGGGAEWHHRYKQGRILLLQQSMKIVDGTKVDETVSFPWPNEAMFLFFVKNNYFYRLWLDRKQAGPAVGP